VIVKRKSLFKFDAKYRERKASIIIMKVAVSGLSFPEAIGLFFLIGWSLSSFASRMSLNIYVAELAKLKERKAVNEVFSNNFEKRFPLKIRAANRARFLVKCSGRATFMTWVIRVIVLFAFLVDMLAIGVVLRLRC